MRDTSHLHIEFYVATEEDEKASRETGMPKFKDTEMVRIKFVGDRNQEIGAPAHSLSFDPDERMQMTYAERFPRHYAAFKENRADYVDGTPLDQLPGITGSKIAEFKAQKVFTIEALAQLEGGALTKLGMHARDWKNKAAIWLERAKDGAIEAKLAAQNADLQAQLDEMRKMIAGAGMTGVVSKDTPKIEVVQHGPFAGHTASDLRTFIKAKGGSWKGNPGLETLLAMASDIMSAEEAANA
jgi:hypothetical protein